jgi:hypothetical protein
MNLSRVAAVVLTLLGLTTGLTACGQDEAPKTTPATPVRRVSR